MTADLVLMHDQPNRRRARWVLACAVVLTVHIATAAVALRHESAKEIASEDVGVQMIVEFAELPAAPEADNAETAQAVDTAAAAPAPEVDEKLSTKSDVDLPTAAATPYDAPQDLQVAQDKTQKETESQENTETTEAMEQRNDAPSAAAQQSTAAAPQTAAIADNIAATTEGSTTQPSEVRDSWYRAVMAHLGRHKRYPQAARSEHIEGEVQLSFVLDSGGRVIRKAIIRSSGSPLLDQEAIAMLERAQPLPAIPRQLTSGQVELVIPVRYRLK